jgi:hypothetical protein
MTLLRLLVLAACIVFPATAHPKDKPPPLDGPSVQFRDKLVDRLAGQWEFKGKVAGQAARYSVTAGWVLNHQFMRIHHKELRPPGKEAPYEAIVFVGRDNMSERYVAHWIDVFGGRASETLGFGIRAPAAGATGSTSSRRGTTSGSRSQRHLVREPTGRPGRPASRDSRVRTVSTRWFTSRSGRTWCSTSALDATGCTSMQGRASS